MNRQEVFEDGNTYIFICPHCGDIATCLKNEVACTIFRHGVYKSNMQPINPHTPKQSCDELIIKNMIYGCAKPFKFIYNGIAQGKHCVEICNYDC